MSSHPISCTCIPILTENLRVSELAMIVCSYIPRESDEHILNEHMKKTMLGYLSTAYSQGRFNIRMQLCSTYGNRVFVEYKRIGYSRIDDDIPHSRIIPFMDGSYVPSKITSYRVTPGIIYDQEHIDAEAAVRADMDAGIQSLLGLPHYWHQ